MSDYKEIPVELVRPNPNQPRTTFDETSIRELADSIQQQGLLQPIVVEDHGDGYVIVGGERRLRAFKLLGRESIPALINERSNHGGRELLVRAMIENVQREDMNPMDQAEAYQRLKDEFGMTWQQIGAQVGKGYMTIQQTAFITKYDPEIKELIRAGKFTHVVEVARAIMRIPSAETRIKLVRKAIDQRLNNIQVVKTARTVEEMMAGEKIILDGAESPAMAMLQKNYPMVSEREAPSGWNALTQTGAAPQWSRVTDSVTKACQACALASLASRTTCGECPLVDFLERLVPHGS